MQFMRGARLSPRHKLAAATPFKPIGDTPPNFLRLPSLLDMWDNDRDGDCVTAEEAFARACAGVFIQPSEVIRWASSHGVLNGADLSEVLDWMAAKGFSQDSNLYNAGPKLAVDWTNAAVLQNAIVQGPVKIAVAAGQLDIGSGGNGWFGLNYRHDANIDHCVALCGYGTIAWLAQALGVSVPGGVDGTKPAYALYTWKSVGVIDTPSMLNITAEAWLRNPTNITVGTGTPTPDPVTVLPTPTPPTPPVPPTPPMPPTQTIPALDLTFLGVPVPGLHTVPKTVPMGGKDCEAELYAWAVANKPGAIYMAAGPSVGITIPPWLLALLRAACAVTVALPAPWSYILGLLCSLIPHGRQYADDQPMTVTVPPWLPPLLSFLCAEVQMIPAGYVHDVASMICMIVAPTKAAPCDGCK